jgi:hypothetical protein
MKDYWHETYQFPRVQLITPDDGHRRCPKHVEFRDKIKFWILHNLHETYQLPRVQLITPDDGHRRCPKHVEFRDKIKFRILHNML